ncbi:MAG TPA: serine hydrolase domain-containing protein, partial [Vicinamibacteria bacterium]
MRTLPRSLLLALVASLALSAATAAKPPSAPAWPLPLATPESQGLSSERLERLHAGIQRFVDEGKHAGAISLVARNGRIVDWRTYGKRDLETSLPMEKDTICRIYSMSKIVTSVAVLALLEEARFRLDDPIGDYLPELSRMKVLTGGTAEKPLLADTKGPITIRHLLTHTSGLTYDFGDGTIDKIFREVKPFEAGSMGEFVERVSRLPLAHEPGERFTYGVSTDVLGALVEKVSGRSLAEFMEERIWRPLGMKDTGFGVPEAKRGRLAKVYE